MLKWCKGYIHCSVKSGHWERFMNLCRHHQIKLWKVKVEESRVTFRMFCGDYKKLKAFVGKTHVVPQIYNKTGFPFVIQYAWRNWTFTVSILLFFVVLKILSLFVWQINYFGQREYTKETVSKEVSSLGVYPGMLRKNLNCDSIERSLRECYDNMSWVSAEEKGCVLNIKIKEGNAEKKKEEKVQSASHLIAPCDGKIERIVTREGTPKVKRGDSVKKGDVLISGVVEIMDDNGEVAKYNGVHAEGELVLLTQEKVEESINVRHMVKNKTGKNIRVYTIDYNGTRFHIKNPLKWFDNSLGYDIINTVCVVKEFVPLNMSLMITKRDYIGYEAVTAEYDEKQAAKLLGQRFASRLSSYEEQGHHIVDKSLKVKKVNQTFQAEGTIKMRITKMEQSDVKDEELLLPDNGKEDENGTGAVDS